MSCFAKLRLVTSPNHLYKKLEEYGADHDSVVKKMVDIDGLKMVTKSNEA